MAQTDETISNFKLETKHFVLIFIGLLISSIIIFFTTLWLFTNPTVTSGIIFGFAILLFLIAPVIMLVIFYFKKIAPNKEEKPEKKILTLELKKE